MASKVYFTRTITPEKMIEMFDLLKKELPGNVAIKLHSGEAGNQNFLRPDFMKPVIDRIGGTVVECNTAYGGERNSTPKHRKLISAHGWDKFFTFDLMDAEGPDMELPCAEGGHLKGVNYVGKTLEKYDSMVVLSHFKGHPMGGFGGALKQLSIGVSSSGGKAWIHSAGKTNKQELCWKEKTEQDDFLESMAEAAGSVVRYFGGNMAFINVMKNLSVDCDCCAVAEDPCMQDIGILASLDPVAIDQACVDLIYAAKEDPGQAHFIERIETRHGIRTVEKAAELGVGSREYELIEVQ